MARSGGGTFLRCGVVGLAATLVCALTPALAGAAPASPLQRGLAFYRGKTVTLISYATVGGSVDVYARILAPVIAQYLHATVEVENIPAGSTIAGQDAVAAATPDGLTFGELSITSDIESAITHTPGLNFNPAREAFLGGPPSSPTLWVSSPSSAYTSFEQIIKSPTPVAMMQEATGTGNTWMRVVNGVFNVKANLITGYSAAASLMAGFFRGDAPVTEASLTDLASYVEGGRARPLLLSDTPHVSPTFAPYLAGVPTIAQLAQKNPAKSRAKRVALQVLLDLTKVPSPMFAAPTATPPDRVAALQAAIRFALTDRALAPVEINASLSPGYVTGPSGKQLYLQLLKLGSALAPYLS